MPNNNPSGVNSFDKFRQEPAYGEKTRDANLLQAAPLTAAPGMTAPKRASRNAQKGRTGEPIAAPPPIRPQPSPVATNISFWQQIAMTPGASPLVQQLAQAATNGQ